MGKTSQDKEDEVQMAMRVMNAVLGGGDNSSKKKKHKRRREEKQDSKTAQKMEKVTHNAEQEPQRAVAITSSLDKKELVGQIFSPPQTTFKGETPVVAVDCEMVGTENNNDALARVSIVNYNGHVLYDKYVRPSGRITDFRTWVSGITPAHLKESNGAISFDEARKNSHRILKDKIIVGHSVHHDFKALQYEGMEEAESKRVRDLTHFPKYKNQFGQIMSLKNLSALHLGRTIQQGQHNSVIDAKASMALYRVNEKEWEQHVKQRNQKNARKQAEQDVQNMRKMGAFLGQKPGSRSKKKKSNTVESKPLNVIAW